MSGAVHALSRTSLPCSRRHILTLLISVFAVALSAETRRRQRRQDKIFFARAQAGDIYMKCLTTWRVCTFTLWCGPERSKDRAIIELILSSGEYSRRPISTLCACTYRCDEIWWLRGDRVWKCGGVWGCSVDDRTCELMWCLHWLAVSRSTIFGLKLVTVNFSWSNPLCGYA